MKKCVVHLSQKNRIGIDPFFVWDLGLFGIAALGIRIWNRKSNLKNLESGMKNRALENRESESKIESGSKPCSCGFKKNVNEVFIAFYFWQLTFSIQFPQYVLLLRKLDSKFNSDNVNL